MMPRRAFPTDRASHLRQGIVESIQGSSIANRTGSALDEAYVDLYIVLIS